MDEEKKWQLIGVIVEMLVKYGPTVVINLADAIATWKNKQDPTADEIAALRQRVPRPESYFKPEAT